MLTNGSGGAVFLRKETFDVSFSMAPAIRGSRTRVKRDICRSSEVPRARDQTEALFALRGLCVLRRGKGLLPLAPHPHPRHDHPSFASLRTDFA